MSVTYYREKQIQFNMVHKKNDYQYPRVIANKRSMQDEVQYASEHLILKLYGASEYSFHNEYHL